MEPERSKPHVSHSYIFYYITLFLPLGKYMYSGRVTRDEVIDEYQGFSPGLFC